MTTPNTNISLTSLDPNTLKQQMASWLSTQSVFTDFNYKGSNLNVLEDLLSRNTFLNSFLMNMTYSEAFMDSAQLRDSVISRAKELNYVPYSMVSSTTTVNIAIQTANLTNFEIPFNTIFTGQNSNGTFNFVTDQNYIATSSNGSFNFSNVSIYDGFYTADLFAIDTTVNNQLFTLSNPNIDITSLQVVVSENAGSTNTVFTLAPNLFGLNGNSTVYFLQAGFSNTYQIQFGDGILGYQPQNGGVVLASYRVCQGPLADDISTFSMITNLQTLNQGNISSIIISSNSPSDGGALAESIDSIKFMAPRSFQTQDNAITGNDYKDLLLQNFPFIKDCNVYGAGINPQGVQYGIVFIAVVTQNGNPATQAIKNDIISYFSNKSILNIPVQIVDPSYLFLNVSTNVHVNFTQTQISPNQYKSEVANTILQWSNNNLEDFGATFRYSPFTDALDAIDPSIISNETTVTMSSIANVTLNTNVAIVINYNNPLVNITSSPFVIGSNTYFLTDTINNISNSGILYLVQYNSNNVLTFSANVGIVNYANGNISVSPLNIQNYPSPFSSLKFTATPQNKDIYCLGNQILQIDSVNGVNINISNN